MKRIGIANLNCYVIINVCMRNHQWVARRPNANYCHDQCVLVSLCLN